MSDEIFSRTPETDVDDRLSRRTINAITALYYLCLVTNLVIAGYYVVKLGLMMAEPESTPSSMFWFFIHSRTKYGVFPLWGYVCCVRRFWGQEIADCGRRWAAKIPE